MQVRTEVEVVRGRKADAKHASSLALSRAPERESETGNLALMSDPVVAHIHAWLREHEQDLLADTRRMLQIPSLESEAVPNGPFGEQNRRALDLALELGNSFGMATKDLDGYAGYAEIGSGEKLVVSLGHLDVVPVSDGWKHAPFGAEIDGEYLYSRGAVDDKGPTMASFYAIRAIRECVPDLKVRLRQVFGCNEESGFKCVEHYVKVEGAPTLGVAPDSMWPLVHGEKNIGSPTISAPLVSASVKLLDVQGGERTNIVLDRVSAKLQVSEEAARKHVDDKLADAWDKNVTWSWSGDVLDIVALGKAAHGSTPFMGDSAAMRIFRFLTDIAPLDAQESFANLLRSTHPSGNGIGIHGRDEGSGPLTANLGVIQVKGDRIWMSWSIRYPVSWTADYLQGRMVEKLTALGWQLESFKDSRGLFFPLDHPLVKTIMDVYEAETGERGKPEVMGGGTYARAIPNCVSIGCGWEGDGLAHENDERIKIEHLFKAARIYAHIFYKLTQIA